MRDTREPQAPPQGDADQPPREFVTVHPDGTKSHSTKRGHRGQPLAPPTSNGKYKAVLDMCGHGTNPPRGNGRWQRLRLGGKR